MQCLLSFCDVIVTGEEKEMATHSSIRAWRMPWTEEPGGLLFIGSHRVIHDWDDLACMHALEKEMAVHSSVLAWRIPWTEEPGGLPSMGSHRVRHDWSDLATAAAVLEKFMLLSRTEMLLVNPRLFFFFFLAVLHSMWDLSSLTSDQNCTLSIVGTKSQPLDCQGSPEP